MTGRLARLFRHLSITGALLLLVDLGLSVAVALSDGEWRIIPPRWTEWPGLLGLALLVTALGLGMALARGWRRLRPLVVLALVGPPTALAIGLMGVVAGRAEIDRITLPDGRVVMMTIEPRFPEVTFALWTEPRGWRWRTLAGRTELAWSGGRSRPGVPHLVVTADGRHLLVRWGDLWTDCLAIRRGLDACLPGETAMMGGEAEWLARSSRIVAAIGTDPGER